MLPKKKVAVSRSKPAVSLGLIFWLLGKRARTGYADIHK